MNEDLRKHVTSTAFVLTLRQTHIQLMVYLDLLRKTAAKRVYRSPIKAINDFVNPVNGLTRRGLVQHVYPPRGWTGTFDEYKRLSSEERDARFTTNDYYVFTAAGEHVLGLLIEAGIYDEVAQAIVALHPIEAPV